MAEPRYVVGIDLGTSHTVVAYADVSVPAVENFQIDQSVAPGEVARRPMLPSLRYHAAAGELALGDAALPWVSDAAELVILGEWAVELGSRVPGRLVASAKSWLSHAAVDRTAPVLPWGAPASIAKVSPLEASASYLRHVRFAWNYQFEGTPLEAQDVVLTVPASFDDGARRLTLEAAELAGLRRVRLLEEPQAACYAWLNSQGVVATPSEEQLRLLLVCDVGGGTTDLTLIRARATDQGLDLRRIGVGDHLMLGGDNMDLALAHVAEGRLAKAGGASLSAAAMSQLTQQCRLAKEQLLGAHPAERATVTVLGGGAGLIGGAVSTELAREEVERMVVDGFFPWVDWRERPQRHRSGIVEFGLPYAPDPAVSRHVADFLARHATVCREALEMVGEADGSALAVPDALLLNGGVFKSPSLTARLRDLLGSWRGAPLTQFANEDPDLAVARGAVAFGLTRHGHGRTIGGGSARSYFLVVEEGREQARRGVCVLPRGSEEGQEIRLETRSFSLRLGQPVRFHLVSTTADQDYHPGELRDLDDDDFKPLPPLAAVLRDDAGHPAAREVPVQLAAGLTEVGTLEMDCLAVADKRRWQLAFDLRYGGRPALDAETTPHPRLGEALNCIERVYGQRSREVGPREVKTLRTTLDKLLGARDGWDTAWLRELWLPLWDGVRRRRRSSDHERVWFNLTGFCLRPGFGFPLDDWRIQQLWPLYARGVQFAREPQVWAEWWTMWRRLAGGLDEPAQTRIYEDVVARLESGGSGKRGGKRTAQEDMVRLLASLERLSVEQKAEAGGWLLKRVSKSGESPHSWWALGRLGARVPFYGSIHTVLPPELAETWLEQLLSLDWRSVQPAAFAAALVARRSGDRNRDLSDEFRARVIRHLRAARAPRSWLQMVETVTALEQADERRAFGDSLPAGLRLVH